MVPYLEFEQKMLDCWNIVNEIDTLYKHYCDDVTSVDLDELVNILLGLKQLYDIKFQKLQHMFEDNVHNGNFRNNVR